MRTLLRVLAVAFSRLLVTFQGFVDCQTKELACFHATVCDYEHGSSWKTSFLRNTYFRMSVTRGSSRQPFDPCVRHDNPLL